MKIQVYLYPDCRWKPLFENASVLIPHLQIGLSEPDGELFLDSLRLYTEKLVQRNLFFSRVSTLTFSLLLSAETDYSCY